MLKPMQGWSKAHRTPKRRCTILTSRPPKSLKRHWVITEGKTEKLYFRALSKKYSLNTRIGDVKGQKHRFIVKANEIKKSENYFEGDEIWIVIDRDLDKNRPQDKQTFKQILNSAREESIEIAYSNDCFELWLLLHYQEVNSPLNCQSLSLKLERKCQQEHQLQYKKTTNIFEYIDPKTNLAIERAEKIFMRSQADNIPPVEANPSTTVYQLVRKLIQSIQV